VKSIVAEPNVARTSEPIRPATVAVPWGVEITELGELRPVVVGSGISPARQAWIRTGVTVVGQPVAP
jgi:hypothetical protein